MCAGTDNECVCIPYELRSEIFPRYTSHLIGYSLNRFFYNGILLSIIIFIYNSSFIPTKVTNKKVRKGCLSEKYYIDLPYYISIS